MNKYHFLYWIKDTEKVSIISAKTIKGACGKFVKNHIGSLNGISIDYEAGIIGTSNFVDISEIDSVKDYIR